MKTGEPKNYVINERMNLKSKIKNNHDHDFHSMDSNHIFSIIFSVLSKISISFTCLAIIFKLFSKSLKSMIGFGGATFSQHGSISKFDVRGLLFYILGMLNIREEDAGIDIF